MKPQEIFDTVVTGLFEQGGPSMDKYGACMYRGCNGRKCAAGWLIPDDLYDPSIEGNSAERVLPLMFGKAPAWTYENLPLIAKMQTCHDVAADLGSDLECMRSRFLVVAGEFDLDPSAVDTAYKKATGGAA